MKQAEGKEAGWGGSSTAQSGGWLGSNRVAGGEERSDGQRCAALLAGLRPRQPRFGGDLVRHGCMLRQGLAGKVQAPTALASKRSNSSLPFIFPTSSPYFLPSVSSREAGRRGEVPRGSNFLPISSRRPPVFSRVKHQPGAPWQRSAPNRARRAPNRAIWMPYARRAR